MKVTLITATYNSAATIPDCLQSVLGQTHSDIEYWIIDGSSTDATLQYVAQAQEQTQIDIKVLSEPDQGIYDALNKGIALATGDIIGFVHSDDLLASPQTIAHIVDAFDTHEVDGVYGDLHYVDARDTQKVLRNWTSQPFRPALLHRGWMPPHPTVFLKAAVYHQHGGFNLQYRIAADYEFILRVFKDRDLQFHYLPEVLTTMRWGGASNSSLKNLIQKSKEDYRALKAHGMSMPWAILLWKNLSKLPQFFRR